MTPDIILTVAQQAAQIALLLVAVVLIPALITGLLVSMFQAATHLNEMTLTFIPKLLVTIGVLMATGPWMLQMLVDYTQGLIESIPYLIG
jgi:flagellar biosynthetic protein FliQ